ncbi:MAG: tetratricopeptide repeat protein [Desulfobacteraceae bacterium]|nr:tetratricopeptide repeat protein [Desulfobacteraceae bacterium]MBC2750813.1 tetratricopeptide repeat protein [Desulfobacteraceae bacterium]
MDVNAKLKIGTRHHQAGRLKDAMAVYEQILHHFPDHPDALHLSGLITHQQGNSDDAIRRIRRAIERHPQNFVFRKNLCMILFAAGKVHDSMRCCQKLIGDFPGSVDMLLLLGNVHMRQGGYQEAADCFHKAIGIESTNADLYHNLGVAYQEMGRLEKALSQYRRAIQLNPDLAEAYYNLGNALRIHSGINEVVVAAYQSALAVRPDYADASFNLSKAFDELERIEEAITGYARTLRIKPDHIDAHNSLGNAYLKQGRYPSAITCYEQAIRINPHFHMGYYNMALACKLQGRMRQAAAFAKQSLALNPEFGDASSLRVQIFQQACAWSDLERACTRLDATTKKEIAVGRCPSEQPFLNFTRHADPALNLRIARAWSDFTAARISRMGEEFVHGHRNLKDGKMVIGYVSERFRNAATAHLMLQLFGLHDRSRFAVYAYSYGKDDGSSYRERIVRDADRFIDIRHLSDLDAARRIYDDGVDVLVDLMGYMKHNRLGIFAFRPAPVQVEYLGYPGTTGADFMDYLIADHVVVPVGEEAFFTERLVRMPHCYQVNDNTQQVSDKGFSRKKCGLPENGFVYCSFNTDYKIDRSTYRTWMNILKQVPGSVLWLIVRSRETRQNLINTAGAAGVREDRLVFAKSLPKHEHLARIKLADLALDTRIVNGHTTTSDCLWVDLPVIALKGNHFASRVSASLLKAVGLPELICDSLKAYESLAVSLAGDGRRLSGIRSKLSGKKMTAPLFDSARTVRSLETAYTRMWENHTKGRGPEPFTVKTD